MKNIIKTFLMLSILASISACGKPEEGLTPQQSVNAKIVRFRIYQNQNIYFDGQIKDEDGVVNITIPDGFDKTKIYPEILVSFGATISPASGAMQDFTAPVKYTVTSESGTETKTYEIFVNK